MHQAYEKKKTVYIMANSRGVNRGHESPHPPKITKQIMSFLAVEIFLCRTF